ncbi:MAG: DUF4147 domain-containing protein [Chloroflexota bacterium]
MKKSTAYQTIETIFNSALLAVDPNTAVSQNLTRKPDQLEIANQTVSISSNRRLFLVSAGKASIPMAQAALNILGDSLYKGAVLTKEGIAYPSFPENVQFFMGSHPVSSQKSIDATNQIGKLLQETKADDLLICLLSGGASALLSSPLIPLATWQSLSRALLSSGCTINEFNAVRRQLDEVKGGGLATWGLPAECHTLILSDVIGNDLAAIGSGPTYFADDDPDEINVIFDKYDILDALSKSEADEILTVVSNLYPAHQFSQPVNTIISDIKIAASAAAQSAQDLGYNTQVLTTQFEGEARELGKFVAAIGKDLLPGHCVILGGESTVTIRGQGMGGRNSELGLSAAIALKDTPSVTIASLATDGDDGATQMAGVVVDTSILKNGRGLGLKAEAFMKNNDSGTYFQKVENQTNTSIFINTGLTGTNVNDLIIILKDNVT